MAVAVWYSHFSFLAPLSLLYLTSNTERGPTAFIQISSNGNEWWDYVQTRFCPTTRSLKGGKGKCKAANLLQSI